MKFPHKSKTEVVETNRKKEVTEQQKKNNRAKWGHYFQVSDDNGMQVRERERGRVYKVTNNHILEETLSSQ